MIDEARVKQMIDIADELIVELADRGFDAAESGVVLGLAAIQTAKALGRSKVEIVDSLGQLCDLCRVEDGATTGNTKQGGAARIFTADSWRSAVLVVSLSGQAFLPTESVKYES